MSKFSFPLDRMQKLVDDVGGGVKYIWYARPGRATTEPFWIIQKETTTVADVETLYAIWAKGCPSNDENFKWSDRLTLTYSAALEISAGTLTTVTMASNNSTTTLAKVGDIATLTIVWTKYMREPTVTIAGRTATCTIGWDSKTWTCAITLAGGDSEWLLPFTIQGYELGWRPLYPVSTLTSGVGVTFDKTAPTLVSAERDSDIQITVSLSEVAKTASITKANAGWFTVVDTETPATTYAVVAIAPGATNDLVVLTVATVAASDATWVTVTYTAGGNGTVADLSGNVLATDATWVSIDAWA